MGISSLAKERIKQQSKSEAGKFLCSKAKEFAIRY
jgi:hypothetical protein